MLVPHRTSLGFGQAVWQEVSSSTLQEQSNLPCGDFGVKKSREITQMFCHLTCEDAH